MPVVFDKEFFAQLGNRTLGDCRSVLCYGSDVVAYPSTECPNCHSVRDRFFSDCDVSEVYCVDCKKWFEMSVV